MSPDNEQQQQQEQRMMGAFSTTTCSSSGRSDDEDNVVPLVRKKQLLFNFPPDNDDGLSVVSSNDDNEDDDDDSFSSSSSLDDDDDDDNAEDDDDSSLIVANDNNNDLVVVGNNQPQQQDTAIVEMVKRLSEKAAIVMISDPVPQHLGHMTQREYEIMKKTEARNFKKAMKCGFWGKKSIQDTILVQLGKEEENEHSSSIISTSRRQQQEVTDQLLKNMLVPHHTVHIPTEEEQQKEIKQQEEEELLPMTPRPQPQSILHIRPVTVTCPSNTTTAQLRRRSRRVSFDKVTVREYRMVLGDHPNCRYGPPVTLDWDYLEYESLNLNDYENHRRDKNSRRSLQKLYLHKSTRERILLEQGNSRKQVNLAALACRNSRWKRDRTIYWSPYWRVEYMFESLGRKLKRRFMLMPPRVAASYKQA